MRNYIAPDLTVRGCVTSTTLGSLNKYTFEPHQPGQPATKIDTLGEAVGAARTSGDND